MRMLAVLLSVLVLYPSIGHASDRDWKLYRNAATGLSFRYPPSLQVRERSPHRPGLPDADAIVDLVDAQKTLVLEFVVYHDAATAFQPLDRGCKPIRLGGEEAAFECVMCWPACMWSVEILSPRLCSISSSDYSSPPLKDGIAPVRSIVETVRFVADDGTNEHPPETTTQPSVRPSSRATPARARAAIPADTLDSKLASDDWSVGASPNLASVPPSMKVLVKFLNALETAVGEDGDIGNSDSDDEHSGYVCSFRFVDLRHNGSLSLVAGIGVPQRPSCRDVFIIDKTASGFELYTGGGSIGDGGDVSASLKDLKHDGRIEFVLDDSLDEQFPNCIARWPVIYAWTGGSYKNVSDQFKDFYRHRLDSIEKRISASLTADSSDDQSDKKCLQAEADRIKKFLDIAPNEGLDAAAQLAQSNDPAARERAAYLLGGIGTQQAQKYLETLTKDTDSAVSFMGKYYLAELLKGPYSPADEFQRVDKP